MFRNALILSLFFTLPAFAETAKMEISGMTCGGCVKAIKAKVCKIEGLADCKVDVGSMELVSKEGTKIDLKKVEELVKSAGDYAVTKSEVK
ncbi:MAG: heavy-metal-associated domain-containing protein [Proteobacteria bacterium]|jgi:copper chaperone CopZ|nr:heavy-metal-associated domain-containing protein [Pseudomonadota bacterium]